MHLVHRTRRVSVVVAFVGLLAAMVSAGGATAKTQAAGGAVQRYFVKVSSAAQYDGLRARAVSLGGKVVVDLPEANSFVVVSNGAVRSTLKATDGVASIASDHVETITVPERTIPSKLVPGKLNPTRVNMGPAGADTSGDPGMTYPGLQWDFNRVGLPQGWDTATGSGTTVGVADTGLDYTHPELADKVVSVADFTRTEQPNLCKAFFGTSDRQLARLYGGPIDTDWNGHGSWIGGNIAADLDGIGINGQAYNADLVSLKISGWCGSAYDSTILQAFHYAATHGIDVVSISFGGYLDRSDPEQDEIWQDYVDTVAFARSHGTVIAASAGNEHTEIGTDGLVLTHGTLTNPELPLVDYFGWYEVPAGIPGVVDVSATGNKVIDSSPSCPPGTEGTIDDVNATCKPESDLHQAAGARHTDQLAYYSNYGSRIDVAAPGGARKFNLPFWDRGGTPGFPYTTADLTNVWEDFSITSDWAVSIPCFFMGHGSGFYQHCYTAIQGTSMATPHVSAILALLLEQDPSLQSDVDAWVQALKDSAIDPGTNFTQVLSATDTSNADLTDEACPQGYCHLGGPAVSNADAYGAGLVQVPGA